MGKPMLEAQESPPFEKPSIEQVIKFIFCSERERDTHANTHIHKISMKTGAFTQPFIYPRSMLLPMLHFLLNFEN